MTPHPKDRFGKLVGTIVILFTLYAELKSIEAKSTWQVVLTILGAGGFGAAALIRPKWAAAIVDRFLATKMGQRLTTTVNKEDA